MVVVEEVRIEWFKYPKVGRVFPNKVGTCIRNLADFFSKE